MADTTQQEYEYQCMECGMVCKGREFHPFAACLMFKACHNGGLVRDSLKFVAENHPATIPQRDEPVAEGKALECEKCEWPKAWVCTGACHTTTTPPSPSLREVRADAARYRLLRRGQKWSVIDGIGDALRADQLDAAIDAALARLEGGERCVS